MSVIQTVIAIGLCVDYAAHVGHCFMLKSGTREERVTKCLGDVGAAVINGGISTFLAVMLLAASASYVFRVLFQQFFLTVVLGLGHGMILLPVLLATVGPQCYAAAEHMDQDHGHGEPKVPLEPSTPPKEKESELGTGPFSTMTVIATEQPVSLEA